MPADIFQEANYWLTTASMSSGSTDDLPKSVEVAVIGAGFTGLSAARTLAKRGIKVAVFEANGIGWGASCRNGGMALTGLKIDSRSLAKRYGMEIARKMYDASIASINLVEHLVLEEKIECNFSRSGHLEVACKQSHFDAYQTSVEFIAKQLGHTLRILPRHELANEIGSSIYFGGIVDQTSAGLNPARYVAGLGAAALQAGAKIFEKTRVLGVVPASRNGRRGFELKTSRSCVFSANVLVATSGYTSNATPALSRKIIPIGSFIITTERLPENLAQELNPCNRMIFDSKHYLHYYRLTPDNRMLFGGRAAFFPESTNTVRRSAEILRREMIEVFPQLRNVYVEYAWGGTLDFCFDTMPHAGEMGGVHYALGYAGHGVAMATYLGSRMAEKICGNDVEIPFSSIPFPGAPFGLYNGKPWFLPFAGAYYKVLDWIS